MDFMDKNSSNEPAGYENIDPDEEESERRHFQSVLTAFSQYRNYTLYRVNKTEKFMSTLPTSHQKRLNQYNKYLSKIKWCIDQNYTIIKDIISDAPDIFINIPSSEICPPNAELCSDDKDVLSNNANGNSQDDLYGMTKTEDIEKVKSILKQIVRDWSHDGIPERLQCYQPIIDEILKEFPMPKGVSILVPGAGLGRLAFEIAIRGYRCQGNEFSLFMLFVGNFILNKCHDINGFKIYPWVHQFVNNLSCENQIKEVSFPDIDPSRLIDADFSMVAGDFLKVYEKPEDWDCVATCFFIDCAPNVIAFVETIYKILKPGGIWINLGPLLYHYSDMANEDSIEPPFDILRDIIKDVGFTFEKSEIGVKTKYSQNPSSMLQQEYNSVFFVCRKPNMDIEIFDDE